MISQITLIFKQVPLKASSLNSNDVFILMSPTVVYIWCGKGSTGDEREMAKKVAADGKADSLIMSEGNAFDSFLRQKFTIIFVLCFKGKRKPNFGLYWEVRDLTPQTFERPKRFRNMRLAFSNALTPQEI